MVEEERIGIEERRNLMEGLLRRVMYCISCLSKVRKTMSSFSELEGFKDMSDNTIMDLSRTFVGLTDIKQRVLLGMSMLDYEEFNISEEDIDKLFLTNKEEIKRIIEYKKDYSEEGYFEEVSHRNMEVRRYRKKATKIPLEIPELNAYLGIGPEKEDEYEWKKDK